MAAAGIMHQQTFCTADSHIAFLIRDLCRFTQQAPGNNGTQFITQTNVCQQIFEGLMFGFRNYPVDIFLTDIVQLHCSQRMTKQTVTHIHRFLRMLSA